MLPATDDTILHALRVEYKQLRYALEFFQPILGTSAGRFLKQVKAMQEILGRINDIAVFNETVNNLDCSVGQSRLPSCGAIAALARLSWSDLREAILRSLDALQQALHAASVFRIHFWSCADFRKQLRRLP